jgi:putative salt-induced outer membrane protein YdiY
MTNASPPRLRFDHATRARARAIGIALVLTAAPALGDSVRLKSGDLISGEIESISDDKLIIDPPFADPIEIKIKYIASIETTRPVTVTFRDGRETTGLVDLDEHGKMRVNVKTSRWEAAHADDPWLLRRNRESVPQEGTSQPIDSLHAVQELELAYYRYEAEIGLGFNAASGNTDSSALSLESKLAPYWGPNSLTLDGEIERRESNGDIDAKNWRISASYERELTAKWFAYLVNLDESDPFQNLNLRAAVGTGGGYKFWDADPNHLELSLGFGYVREDFSVASADRDFGAAIWELDGSRDFFNGDVTFYHQDFVIKALTAKQLLLKTTQGVKLDLPGDFDLKLEVQYDYTADPAPGVLDKNDFRYVVKLDYEFEGDETDWLH